MPATPSANVAGRGSSYGGSRCSRAEDEIAERGGKTRVRAEVESVGDHAVVRGVEHAGRQRLGRPVGRSAADRHRARAVAVGDHDLRADAFDPRRPARAGDRVITTGGPQSAAVLCITPAQPDRVSKCTTNASSAVRVLVRDARRARALTPANSPSVTRSWSITCEPCAPNQPPPPPRRPTTRERPRPGRRAPARSSSRSRAGARRSRPSGPCGPASPGPASHRNSVPSTCTIAGRFGGGEHAPRLRPRRVRTASRRSRACPPRSRRARARRACAGGVAIVIASTPSSASASSSDVSASGTPNCAARSRVRSGSRPTSACTSNPGGAQRAHVRDAAEAGADDDAPSALGSLDRSALRCRAASCPRRRRSRRARACWRSSRRAA